MSQDLTRDLLLVSLSVVIWSALTLGASFYRIRGKLKGDVRTRLLHYLYYLGIVVVFFTTILFGYVSHVLPLILAGIGYPISALVSHQKVRFLASWTKFGKVAYLPISSSLLLTLQLYQWYFIQQHGHHASIEWNELFLKSTGMSIKLGVFSRVISFLIDLLYSLYPIILIKELGWKQLPKHMHAFIIFTSSVFFIRIASVVFLFVGNDASSNNALLVLGFLFAIFLTYMNSQFSISLRTKEIKDKPLLSNDQRWQLICELLQKYWCSNSDKDPLDFIQQEGNFKDHELKQQVSLNVGLSLHEFKNYLKVENFLLLSQHLSNRHTLEHIALLIGFKSRSTLNRWVKRFARSTPKRVVHSLPHNSPLIELRKTLNLSHNI